MDPSLSFLPLLRHIALIQIEIKMQHVLPHNAARAAVAEVEFLEEFDRGLALDEGVEGDLQIAALLAEFEGGFDQSGADAAATLIDSDAQTTDFADVVLVVLHADHSDHFRRALVMRDRL